MNKQTENNTNFEKIKFVFIIMEQTKINATCCFVITVKKIHYEITVLCFIHI
jgi:hypothetical protein